MFVTLLCCSTIRLQRTPLPLSGPPCRRGRGPSWWEACQAPSPCCCTSCPMNNNQLNYLLCIIWSDDVREVSFLDLGPQFLALSAPDRLTFMSDACVKTNKNSFSAQNYLVVVGCVNFWSWPYGKYLISYVQRLYISSCHNNTRGEVFFFKFILMNALAMNFVLECPIGGGQIIPMILITMKKTIFQLR